MITKNFFPYEEHGFKEEVRLVIYDLSSKSYILKSVIKPKESYQLKIEPSYSKKNLKFKYQIYDGVKWKDADGGLKLIFNTSSKGLLNTIDFIDNKEFNISALESASESQLSFTLKHMINKVYEYLFKKPSIPRANRTLEYLQAFDEKILLSSDLIPHFHSQLSILAEFISYREENKNIVHTYSSDMMVLNKIIEEYKFIYLEKDTVKSGILVAKGSVLSIYNRKMAYDAYQEALEIFHKVPYMSSFLIVDAITTYYPDAIEENRTYSIHSSKYNEYNENLNVCFSTDTKYFRMFAYIWANASLSFEKINFNFGIVTETIEEYQQLVSEYQDLLTSCAKLKKLSYPHNNRFYWIDSSITNRTVYACARFYLSKLLLEDYPSDVYISDIDQMVIGDLESYLLKINSQDLHADVYLPMSPNYYKLLVGRSHMAGNIYMRNNQQGKEYAELLCDYSGKGLEEYSSWMLDQNATRYASEFIPTEELGNLGQRVLKQYPSFKVALRGK